jgi:hypothetical protein
MNAPIVRHMIKLGMMKKFSTNMFSINPIAIEINVIAAHMLNPMTEAPTKRKVALLELDKFEGVILTYPIRPIRSVIVSIKNAISDSSSSIMNPTTEKTVTITTVSITQYQLFVVIPGVSGCAFRFVFG